MGVQIGARARYGPAEVLFDEAKSTDPSKKTLQSICTAALKTVDSEFREECLERVIVAGGGSMLPGLPKRLEKELSEAAGVRKVQVDSQRKYAAWLGGSMFASFSTFEHFLISKDDYEESRADLKALISR